VYLASKSKSKPKAGLSLNVTLIEVINLDYNNEPYLK
jgi:hypothetical protein